MDRDEYARRFIGLLTAVEPLDQEAAESARAAGIKGLQPEPPTIDAHYQVPSTSTPAEVHALIEEAHTNVAELYTRELYEAIGASLMLSSYLLDRLAAASGEQRSTLLHRLGLVFAEEDD